MHYMEDLLNPQTLIHQILDTDMPPQVKEILRTTRLSEAQEILIHEEVSWWMIKDSRLGLKFLIQDFINKTIYSGVEMLHQTKMWPTYLRDIINQTNRLQTSIINSQARQVGSTQDSLNIDLRELWIF